MITVLLIMGLLAMFFVMPSFTVPSGMEQVSLIRGDGWVILSSDRGYLRLDVGRQVTEEGYSPRNPYSFFSEIADDSRIDRIEILPYLGKMTCNAVISGKGYTTDVRNCIAIALRKDVPVFVSRDLLTSKYVPAEGF